MYVYNHIHTFLVLNKVHFSVEVHTRDILPRPTRAAGVRADRNYKEFGGEGSDGQFSKVQSGKKGPAPARFELSKGIWK